MDVTKDIKIRKFNDGNTSEAYDQVVVEYPLTIYINSKQYRTLLCTPDSLHELVVGYLKSENIIKKFDDVKRMTIDDKSGEAFVEISDTSVLEMELNSVRMVTSGCAANTVFYNGIDKIILKGLKFQENKGFDHNIVLDNMSRFQKMSELFIQTGGVHSCALFEEESVIVSYDDIGRHNAMDKISGYMLMTGVDGLGKAIYTSGRISSEMVLKAAKAGISAIVSRSAPMDMAIRIANELNMTLVGFARGNRYNIY